jgi:predicted dehydrogenase
MTRTRITVIGCGRWGPHHVRVFNSLPGCEVGAVVDTDHERMAAILETWPRTTGTTDVDEGLAAADAVVIATPMSTHVDLVRRALLEGKPVASPCCARSRCAGPPPRRPRSSPSPKSAGPC